MPQHKSAERRMRTTAKKNTNNRASKSKMRTLIKSVREAGTPEEANAAYRKTTALLDRLAAKGVIHKNMAANKKSRLRKTVKALDKKA